MIMRNTFLVRFPARQGGATLVVALLILVLIMMIGITAVSTSDTQFKLAGNLQFEDGAINNTETAITAAERWLSTGTNFSNAAFTAAGPDPDVATPQILPLTIDAAVRTARIGRAFSMTWDNSNSVSVPDPVTTTPNPDQRYFIELMSLNNRLQGSSQVVGGRTSAGCNQVNTYLITGRGASARGATKFVQSYFSVLSCPA